MQVKYRNQYFISSREHRECSSMRMILFNNLFVYAGEPLNIYQARNQHVEILLIGFIINPLEPCQSDSDILNKIVLNCYSIELLFKEIQQYSGRYVLLYKNDKDFIALNDACSLRQLYFSDSGSSIDITSSEKLYLDINNFDLNISDEKYELIKSLQFKKTEHLWIGNKGIDDRLLKILPNHYLDIKRNKIFRIPYYDNQLVNEKEIYEYVCSILLGSVEAITKRFVVLQALTGGWDSRVLLAAAKNNLDKINFFVFDHSKSNSSEIYFNKNDVDIPLRLSEKLGFTLSVIDPAELNDLFLALFSSEHLFPRIIPKTKEIQYHFHNYANSKDKIVRVSGVGGGIPRCFHGFTKQKITNDMLQIFSGYGDHFNFVNEEINHWLEDSIEFSRVCGIPILDLFHWEQKLGNWGPLFALEQDICMEEFWPFSNKELLFSLMKIQPQKRMPPNYIIFNTIIEMLWSHALEEPMNPTNTIKYFKKIMKRSSILQYYNHKFKSLL